MESTASLSGSTVTIGKGMEVPVCVCVEIKSACQHSTPHTSTYLMMIHDKACRRDYPILDDWFLRKKYMRMMTFLAEWELGGGEMRWL